MLSPPTFPRAHSPILVSSFSGSIVFVLDPRYSPFCVSRAFATFPVHTQVNGVVQNDPHRRSRRHCAKKFLCVRPFEVCNHATCCVPSSALLSVCKAADVSQGRHARAHPVGIHAFPRPLSLIRSLPRILGSICDICDESRLAFTIAPALFLEAQEASKSRGIAPKRVDICDKMVGI